MVIVWSIDRITRQGLRSISHILDALDAGNARLVSATQPVDSSDPMGELILGVMATMAKSESEAISGRVRRAATAAAVQGKIHGGGHRCFGYDRGGQIIADEAKALRLMGDALVDGMPLRQIARLLNSLDIRTTAGNQWTPESVSQTLRSPRLRGYRQHNGSLYRGNWEPIFSEAEHLRIMQALADGWTSSPRRPGNQYLLTGLAVCAICGSKLGYGKAQGGGKIFLRYVCKKQPGRTACGGVSVTMASLDQFVVESMLDRLRTESTERATVEAVTDDRVAELRRAVEDHERTIRVLEDDYYLHRRLDESAYTRLRIEIEDRIGEAEAEIMKAGERPPTRMNWSAESDCPERIWANFPISEQRDILRSLVEAVEVRRAERRGGNKFDRSRVTIRWLE